MSHKAPIWAAQSGALSSSRIASNVILYAAAPQIGNPLHDIPRHALPSAIVNLRVHLAIQELNCDPCLESVSTDSALYSGAIGATRETLIAGLFAAARK